MQPWAGCWTSLCCQCLISNTEVTMVPTGRGKRFKWHLLMSLSEDTLAKLAAPVCKGRAGSVSTQSLCGSRKWGFLCLCLRKPVGLRKGQPVALGPQGFEQARLRGGGGDCRRPGQSGKVPGGPEVGERRAGCGLQWPHRWLRQGVRAEQAQGSPSTISHSRTGLPWSSRVEGRQPSWEWASNGSRAVAPTPGMPLPDSEPSACPASGSHS